MSRITRQWLQKYQIGDHVALQPLFGEGISEGYIFGYTVSKGHCILSPGVKAFGESVDYRIVYKVSAIGDSSRRAIGWYIKGSVHFTMITQKLDPPLISEIVK